MNYAERQPLNVLTHSDTVVVVDSTAMFARHSPALKAR